jgi:cytochrome c oxidase assembly protein subunit 19
MSDPFGGSRVQVKPPERGVFPLDHDGECKPSMESYLSCLKNNKRDHFPCKDFSRAYLQCRMDKSLMAKEDLDTLGLGNENREYTRVKVSDRAKKENGFLAGLDVKASNKGFFK